MGSAPVPQNRPEPRGAAPHDVRSAVVLDPEVPLETERRRADPGVLDPPLDRRVIERRLARAAVSKNPAAAFHVTQRPAEVAGKPLWIVAVIFAVVAAVCYLTFNAHHPDPDYLRAVKLVSDFELAKSPDAINYLDTIYTEALGDLERVDPTSISAGLASALTVDIRRKQNAFVDRMRANQARIDAERALTTARDETLFQAQKMNNGTDSGAAERVAATPAPECAEDAATRKRRAAEVTH